MNRFRIGVQEKAGLGPAFLLIGGLIILLVRRRWITDCP